MKRLMLNLDLTAVIVLIAVGVLLPVMLATAAGIVALVIARNAGSIVTGVLVISFAIAAAGSGIIAVVLTGKKACLARRQADFVANISHEFRTPLSAIRLYAQTLQSGKLRGDPEQMSQCLATILRETEWLDVMVDRVLMWRASSKDVLPLEMEVKPVVEAVEDAIKRFRTMVVMSDLDFECSIDSRLPVQHDPLALNAVILNLLINAYKYTGQKKWIRLVVRDEANEVVIEVLDNGMGLAILEQRRVFEAFYRVERHDGTNSKGAGLGLAVARHLVERHGGSISVSSEKSMGSTFTVKLPGESG
ncbi:MAG: HAMP domain-containing histidine kinase [Kiritimatiellae bacterium]|nr:HAMP domain-containing histidine kinase [Kiritimatiellia bacterium]